MITIEEIEIKRSPQELKDFVTHKVSTIREIPSERHEAIKKKGLYKKFCDEIAPLSSFCVNHYSEEVRITPIMGSQGFDAVVEDMEGNHIEYIEITLPHDGDHASKVARKVVEKGGSLDSTYFPGDDLLNMFSIVLQTCKNKSKKDYSDSLLLIIVIFLPPHAEFISLYIDLMNKFATKVKNTVAFTAKFVFLYAPNINYKIQLHP